MRTIKPHGQRTLVSVDEAMRRVDAYQPAVVPTGPTDVRTGSDIFILDNVNCVMPPSGIFEMYKTVHIDQTLDEEDNGDGDELVESDLEDAIRDLEGMGHFLPSMALTCNSIRMLYEKYFTVGYGHDDIELKTNISQFMFEYFRKEDATFAQNTVIADHDAENEYVWIYHYPESVLPLKDPKYINDLEQHTEFRMPIPSFRNLFRNYHDKITLDDALKDRHATYLIKILTGLEDPHVLEKASLYFTGKPVNVHFSKTQSGSTVYETYFRSTEKSFDIVISDLFLETHYNRGAYNEYADY